MIASMVYYGVNTAGVKIDYLSPTNEMDDVGFPEGPAVDRFQYVRLVDKLLAKLSAHGVTGIGLVGPDVANVSNLTNAYLPQVFGDSTIRGVLKHVSFHDYFGNPGTADAAVKASGISGLDWWVTEYAGGLFYDADRGVPIPNEWGFSEKSFQDLLQFINAGAAGATVYNGVDEFYQHHGAVNSWGQIAWDQTTDTYPTRKRFYANGQVFKFVTPGESRVGSSTTDTNLVQAAFTDSSTGRITITGQNVGTSGVTINGTLTGGLSASTFQLYFTNADLNMTRQADVPVISGKFSFFVPADTIFTLYAPGSGGGGAGFGGPVLPASVPATPLIGAIPDSRTTTVSSVSQLPGLAIALSSAPAAASVATGTPMNSGTSTASIVAGSGEEVGRVSALDALFTAMGTATARTTSLSASSDALGPDPFADPLR
jgi:hypothetical protein